MPLTVMSNMAAALVFSATFKAYWIMSAPRAGSGVGWTGGIPLEAVRVDHYADSIWSLELKVCHYISEGSPGEYHFKAAKWVRTHRLIMQTSEIHSAV
jgi:hypothetical protein